MRDRRRPLAAVLAVVVAVAATAITLPGGRGAFAATGTAAGTVSGTGSITVSGVLKTVSISATTDGSSPGTSGSFTIADNGGTPSAGDVTCLFLAEGSAVVGAHLPSSPGPDLYGLIFITDGGPTGLDTMGLTQPSTAGPADCTSTGSGATLTSGDFTVTIAPTPSLAPSAEPSVQPSSESSDQASPEPSTQPSPEPSTQPSSQPSPAMSGGPSSPPAPDANGDGIHDSLQPSGTPYGAFRDDSLSPPTVGSIVSTSGLSISIVDAPLAADGVLVSVGSEVPGAQVELSVCGGFAVFLDAGTVVVGTCGSVTLSVSSGAASVRLGSGITTVAVPAGAKARVTANVDGSFGVANLGPVNIGLTVDGVPATIGPGATTTARTIDFVGFAQPVDNLPTVNRVKAGQAIPVKWRLLSATGAPITDLSSATMTVSTFNCALGTSTDLIEEVVAGASGLQNLGNGYYQLNWKSPKTYAESCKVLHLDVHDGVSHDSRWNFTK